MGAQNLLVRGGIVGQGLLASSMQLLIAESDIVESNSPALTELCGLCRRAFHQVGHFFTLSKDGVTSQLERLFHQHSIDHVQAHPHLLIYRGGTVEGQLFVQDLQHLFRTHKPFLQKWLRITRDYEQLYLQMLQEIEQPDFIATWRLLTVWGTFPS